MEGVIRPTRQAGWLLDRTGRVPYPCTSVTTPTTLRLFEPINVDKPYPEQVKPFNFLIAAFVDPTERPVDEDRIVLVAPYEADPAKWSQGDWINRFSGRAYQITTEPSAGRVRPGIVIVKTYGDTILDYATHPEPKSCAADGTPCDRTTIGLLVRRPIDPTIIQHIGKESNRLEETHAGLLDDSDDHLSRYGDRDLTVFRELAVPILRQLGVRETARRTGHGLGAVSSALNGRSTPRAAALNHYLDLALEHARELLTAAELEAPTAEEGNLRQAIRLLSSF
jgi:hypothetical protein